MKRETKVHLWIAFHVVVIIGILFGLGALLFLYNATKDPCAFYEIRHDKLGLIFQKGKDMRCKDNDYEFRHIQPADIRIEVVGARTMGFIPKPAKDVLVTHIPTGLTALSTESRSLHANKFAALEKLDKMLVEHYKREDRCRGNTVEFAAANALSMQVSFQDVYTNFYKDCDPVEPRVSKFA